MKLLTLGKSLIITSIIGMSANAFALEVGSQAPCVVLDIVNPDNSSTLSCIRDSRADQNFTILEFFATNCGACIQNIPNLSSLTRQLDSVATVRSVAIDRDVNRVYNLLNNRPDINFSVALDFQRDAMRAYGIRLTPTLFILNSNNTIVYKHIGLLKPNDIAQIKATVGL